MKLSSLALSVAATASIAVTARPSLAQEKPAAPKWSATGTLFESCTCAVPCTCNFGQGPSPHSYCNAIFAYRLDKATYDGIDLSGLIVGGADGPKGTSGFVDDRATAAQRPALEKLGAALFAEGGPAAIPAQWLPTKMLADSKPKTIQLTVGEYGGFTADMLMGRDGKTPIVVENNTIWPVKRANKAKSRHLYLVDDASGTIDASGVNANFGTFDFTSAGK